MADIALKNLKTVNNILNNDMEDDRTQFNQLSEELLKRAAFARDEYEKASSHEEKGKEVEKSFEYLIEGVAVLAYNLTMSTSRLDESLNLVSDSLDTLASNIKQITLQVYIEEERKNKASLDKLTCIRTPVIRHMTQTMEMEESPWKDGIPKYKRSMVKLPLLRPDSFKDIGSEGQSDGGKSGRSSKALSTDGLGTNRKTSSTMGRSRQKLSTLKKFQMTTLQKQSVEKKKDDIAEDVAPDTSEAEAVNTETVHVDTLDHILDQLKLETENVPDNSTDTFNDYFPEFDESETLNRVSLSDIMNTEEDVQIKPRKEINNSSRVMSIVVEEDFDEPLPTPPDTPSASVSEEFRISSLPTLPEEE